MSHTFAHSTTATAPEISKRIAYNRETRDYDCLVAIDGGAEQYIGSASTYSQAEVKRMAYLDDTRAPTAPLSEYEMELAERMGVEA